MRLAVGRSCSCSLTAVAPRSFRPQARLAARPTCLANCIGFRWIMDNNSPYLGILGLLSFAQLISPRPKFLPTRRARAETMQMNRVADGPQADDELPLASYMGPLPNVCHISPSARPADHSMITRQSPTGAVVVTNLCLIRTGGGAGAAPVGSVGGGEYS